MVEYHPSKVAVDGSSPLARSTPESPESSGKAKNGFFGEIKAMVRWFRPNSSAVEHFLGKEEVSGSIPDLGSTPAFRGDESRSFGSPAPSKPIAARRPPSPK